MLEYLWLFNILARVSGVVFLLCLYNWYGRSPDESFPSHHRTKGAKDTCGGVGCTRCNNATYEAKALSVLTELNKTNSAEYERLNVWSKGLGKKVPAERVQRPTVFYMPNLHTTPTIDNLFHSDDVNTLESSFDAIMLDFLSISTNLNVKSGWKLNSTPSGSWKIFFLINQGVEIKPNSDRCHETLRVLNQLSGLLQHCTFGNACFSVVDPGTTIAEHCGPCNVRTRCHLGLRIPDKWSLKVSGSRNHWLQGKCLLFDDSFPHSVHHENDSEPEETSLNQSRVVFMVDLWHYNVTEPERVAIRKMFPSAPNL